MLRTFLTGWRILVDEQLSGLVIVKEILKVKSQMEKLPQLRPTNLETSGTIEDSAEKMISQ